MTPGSSMQIFFFSSRRRHTRLQGDWSSDVCSSDLRAWEGARREFRPPRFATAGADVLAGPRRPPGGSEERRVGKAGRGRWETRPGIENYRMSLSDGPGSI